MSKSDPDNRIFAPVGNYYGTPYVVKRKNGCYIGMENYDGIQEVEISEEFYGAFTKEFINGHSKEYE